MGESDEVVVAPEGTRSSMEIPRFSALRRLGYWTTGGDDGLPDVEAYRDEEWDDDVRDDVAGYLRHGLVARRYLGPSRCRVCGLLNGNLELTDLVFIWPEGLAHYVQDHQVRLPAAFVDHVEQMNDAVDDAAIDEAWWLQSGPPS